MEKIRDLDKLSYREVKQYFLDLEYINDPSKRFDTLVATRLYHYGQRTINRT